MLYVFQGKSGKKSLDRGMEELIKCLDELMKCLDEFMKCCMFSRAKVARSPSTVGCIS